MDAHLLSLKPLNAETTGPLECAIRLKAPTDVARLPVHMILLLDVSESMMDGNKLNNVKACANLIVNLLNADDRISLITFGEYAKLHLKRVSIDDAQKTAIRDTINSLDCDGCTNLSAGLGYVREVCEGDTQKAGLLLLTDGHANRGVSHGDALRRIVKSLSTSFPHLSICGVAYGKDHNEDLMKGIAEDSQGAYNVVNTIEDTAFAFGDTLGGLMSCAFQNVKLKVPRSATVHGLYKTTMTVDALEVQIGDVYAGTQPTVLFDLPRSEMAAGNPTITLSGMTLPDYTNWSMALPLEQLEGRDREIELTKLRYRCTDLLKRVREWSSSTPTERSQLTADIDAFERDMADEFLDGHPITTTLRNEVVTLRDLIQMAQRGPTREFNVMTQQHSAYIGLGRGFSTPARAAPATPARHMGPRRATTRGALLTPMGDPEEADEPTPVASASASAVPEAAFQNRIQYNIASLMTSLSQGGNVENPHGH